MSAKQATRSDKEPVTAWRVVDRVGDDERVTGSSGNAGGAATTDSRRDDPAHVVVRRYVVHNGNGPVPVVELHDQRAPINATTCRRPGHHAARSGRSAGLRTLDCPCDVVCSRCDAQVGFDCTTPTGYNAKAHQQRVTVSPRCQGIVDGTRTACDRGEHEWLPVGTHDPAEATEARCGGCGRIEPVRSESLTYGQRYLGH